jgi:hypothetical protein
VNERRTLSGELTPAASKLRVADVEAQLPRLRDAPRSTRWREGFRARVPARKHGLLSGATHLVDFEMDGASACHCSTQWQRAAVSQSGDQTKCFEISPFWARWRVRWPSQLAAATARPTTNHVTLAAPPGPTRRTTRRREAEAAAPPPVEMQVLVGMLRPEGRTRRLARVHRREVNLPQGVRRTPVEPLEPRHWLESATSQPRGRFHPRTESSERGPSTAARHRP